MTLIYNLAGTTPIMAIKVLEELRVSPELMPTRHQIAFFKKNRKISETKAFKCESNLELQKFCKTFGVSALICSVKPCSVIIGFCRFPQKKSGTLSWTGTNWLFCLTLTTSVRTILKRTQELPALFLREKMLSKTVITPMYDMRQNSEGLVMNVDGTFLLASYNSHLTTDATYVINCRYLKASHLRLTTASSRNWSMPGPVEDSAHMPSIYVRMGEIGAGDCLSRAVQCVCTGAEHFLWCRHRRWKPPKCRCRSNESHRCYRVAMTISSA